MLRSGWNLLRVGRAVKPSKITFPVGRNKFSFEKISLETRMPNYSRALSTQAGRSRENVKKSRQSLPRWSPSRRCSTECIVSSPFPERPIPEVDISQYVWRNIHRWADKTAMECGVTGRRYTFGEVREGARKFGSALVKMGLQRQDVVGVCGPNIPEYVVPLLGTLEAGGSVTAFNPLFTAGELGRQVRDSRARYVVTIRELLPVMREVQQMGGGPERLIVIGEPQEGCVSILEMLADDGHSLPGASLKVDVRKDVALLLYSSGTTGKPKGVMLTHSNVVAMMDMWHHFQLHKETTDSHQEILLAVLPFFHIYGMITYLLLAPSLGMKVVTLPRFQPEEYVKALRTHKPTNLQLVPSLANFLCNHPEVTPDCFQNVHHIFSGAAATGPALARKLADRVQPYNPIFLEGYGLTEGGQATLAGLTHLSGVESPPGSCGVVVPHAQVKVVDLTSGQSLGPNQQGELYVRGEQVMRGYLNNPEATAQALSDTWLRTGDIGYYDDNSCFYIVDRLKEMIKVKQMQVSPSELEDLLQEHPGVMDVGVIGVPDEKAGELPRAYIVRHGPGISEQDITDFLEEKVAPHKKLLGGVVFVDSIPKSPTGKILRRNLKQLAVERP